MTYIENTTYPIVGQLINVSRSTITVLDSKTRKDVVLDVQTSEQSIEDIKKRAFQSVMCIANITYNRHGVIMGKCDKLVLGKLISEVVQ